MSRVFRKTPKGAEAFANKESGLSHPHRALLVLVDGKRNASQLRKFGASFGNVNGLLGELFEAKLIELDPAYIAKLTTTQAEIARESAGFSSSLAAETVIAGSSPRSQAGPVTLGGSTLPALSKAGGPVTRGGDSRESLVNPATQTKPQKRDLRELALLAEPDPVQTAESLAIESAAFLASKQFAIDFIQNSLGNSGTPLRFALERTDSLARLREVIEIATGTLRDMRGTQVATEFRRGFDSSVAQGR
ncbi:MAG: hypothetical protein EAZ21_10725 [Betaproteobacteria bacterium]|nr:MAG: hypothetical protein EAZ21_10725 [Betaproteobacteria bacterium]